MPPLALATPAATPLHLPYAHALRSLAISAVVLIHVHVFLGPPLDQPAGHAGYILSAAAHWAVPVFIMLSGALLLDPARTDSTPAFYRRRLLRIGLPTVAWSAFYLLWRTQYLDQEISWPQLKWLILTGEEAMHTYFLYIILGLYAVTPFLRTWIRHAPRSQVLFAAWLCLGASVAWCLLYGYLGVPDWRMPAGARQWRMPTRPLIIELFIPYLGYFLTGYVLRNVRLTRWPTLAAWLILLLAIAASAAGFIWQVNTAYEGLAQRWFFSYLSLPVALASIAAFLLIVRHFSSPPRPLAWLNSPTLGSSAFGVYLIHVALLDALKHHNLFFAGPLAPLADHRLLAIALWFPAILLASFLLTWLWQRIPLARHLIGAA
ncbi:MAG: acyltransferase [Phycisphaeraceae bacterium]|nr:acyltransferase [Phycisphaeraceae bacterium]